ncbi:hypothetical protein D3C81_1804830 [compost metagenome]
MLDDKLTVGDPQFHILQIMRVKPGFLHCLIQGVEQCIVCLVHFHSLIGQRRCLRIVAENQSDSLLIRLQRLLGIFT